MEGPLSGIRVLDFTQLVAGSSGAQLLGDMGAEVLKIEPPGGEKIRRDRIGGPTHGGDNLLFLGYNRNKKSVCMDLRTPAGLEAFYDLVRVSDVVYDNFKPRAMANMKADYETLSKINPRIICMSSSGYGSTGSLRDRPGGDMVAQAFTGLASVTGFPGSDPVKCGPAIVDICTGIFGALGVTCALQQRARTGRGLKVETSLMNVGVYLMGYHLVYYLLSGEVPPRLGNGHIFGAPHGIYRARDGKFVAIGAGWPRIARVLGEEWMIEDERFKTPQARVSHREELDRYVSQAFLKLDASDWLEMFEMEDIGAAPVNEVDEVAIHPQVLAQEMIFRLRHRNGGEVGLVNNPIRVIGGPTPEDYTSPPGVDEQTQEVLTGILGYSKEKVQEIRRQQEEHFEELQKHTVKKQ